jgi:hypothetical protein
VLFAQHAAAVGLGEIDVRSALGEALEARIPLTLTEGEFVDDRGVGEGVKDGGGDPAGEWVRRCANCGDGGTYGSRTNHPPMLTPRTFSEPQENATLRLDLFVVN